MRRLLGALAACAAARLLCVNALAAEGAEIVRAFVQDSTLYTYVELAETDRPVTQARAGIGGQTFSAAHALETVRQAGSPVTYLLLVDNSTSMPPFREELAAYAGALAAQGGEHTRYLLATFGDAVSLSAEEIPAEDLAEAMEALPFDEDVTRLHSCIDQALDAFEAIPREGSELRCMVVLSDAVQYDPAGGVSHEDLLERLSGSDVMLHAVGVGGDSGAIESLGLLAEASGGTSCAAADPAAAAEDAEQLAALNGAMLVTGFDLTGCTASGADQPLTVTFASGGELLCRAESTVDLPEQAETADGQTEPPVQLPPSGNTGAAAQAAPAEEPDGGPAVPPLVWIIGGAAVLAAALAAVLLRKKKQPAAPAAPAAPPAPEAAGIFLRVETVCGTLAGDSPEYTLVRELTVGRDGACDIVFDDPSVSRRHARVFLAEDTVYLEDLGSQNGTRVNGTAISMPCALRSGDTLTTGEVVWKLKF